MATKRKNMDGYENPLPVLYENCDHNNNNIIPKSNETEINQDKNKESSSEADLNIKTLDLNNYATRKTIAQGLLDLALLSANASQLKYILTSGETHEFYNLLLTLIIVSIILQVLQAIVCVILGMVFNINKVDEQKSADITNNICLAINIITVVVNVVISAFDIKALDNERNSKTL